MSLTDAELRQLRDLLIKPFRTLDQRRYFLSLAFPRELNRYSAIPLKGTPREFAWRLIRHYYRDDRNALLTILNVIQDEEGGNLARALQPFVEKLTLTNARYKIFVSYRRKSGYFMHSVVRDLRARMPNYEFFVDFASIDSADFGESIRRHLAGSHCFLLMLTADTLDPERLFKPDDWIRYEVRLALERGLPIIQVADENTPFARKDQLPEDIQALAEREGRRVLLDPWEATLGRLIEFIPKAIANPPQPMQIAPPSPPHPAQTVTPAAAVIPSEPPDYQAMLRKAAELDEAGDYEAALPLLKQLKAARYKSKVVEPLLKKAQGAVAILLQQRAEEEARQQRLEALREAYEDIALLARSQITQETWQDWLIFQKEYPKWREMLNGDPHNLYRRFVGAFVALRTFEGHTNVVSSVAWSPYGLVLASGSRDGTVRLWDGRHMRTLEMHTDWVKSVAWSPDGRYLASGSDDKTIRLWDTQTLQFLRTFTGHTGSVFSVAWSPDGRLLASGASDKTVRLWDTQTGQSLQTLTGHTAWVKSVAWSPDGRVLASGSEDKTVRLWDTQTGRLTQTLEGHANWVNSVAWSPDRRYLASGSDDKTVRLWDIEAGLLRTLENHENWVRSVAWSPDGQLLVSGSDDKTVRLWDTQTGQLLRTLEGHTNWVRSVAWSPDGRYLASGSEDKTIIIWGIPE